MITVVVPTMWRGREINIMLPQLNDHPLVGEIILIDNAPDDRVKETCELSKIKYVSFGKNIYVNPAWNYGWENAKYDKLLFINDDVVFSIALVDAMYDKINETNGMISLDPVVVHNSITGGSSLVTNRRAEHIKFETRIKLRHKAAIVFAIHKSSYTKIPEELLIYYGDSFLFRMCQKNNRHNITAMELEARTIMSSTSASFREIYDKETEMFVDIFKANGLEV